MQIFPTNWNDFLTYYRKETNKEYGHVVLDFHPQTHNDDRIVKFYQNKQAILNNENASNQQSIAQPQGKDDEKFEQQQHNTFQTEQQQNPISEVNDIFVKKKEDQEYSVVKDFLTQQQQHVLGTIQQSILDLKQETMRSKIQEQHDLELLKQSLFDLKQSVTSDESAHRVDMVETNDNFESSERLLLENTEQSCLVKDGAKKKVTKYNKNADEEKLLQIFRDQGYPIDE